MMRFDKTMEQLIRELEELRSRVSLSQYSIDHAADIVFWVKPDSRLYYVNDAACRLLGYAKEELLSLSIPDIDMDPRYSREHWPAHWEDLKRRKSFTFESAYRRKDGSTFPVEISVNYLKFEGREYDFAFVKDITRRKGAEEQLRAAKAQAELYVDLMGHDINNMNQVAIGYLELALNKLALEGKLEEGDRQLLERPVNALMNSAKLIDSVRKLQGEKAGLFKPIAVDVDTVLRRIKEQFSAVPGRDVEIRYEPAGRCCVKANELLTEVFSNLVGNAIKHSEGPLAIDIGLEPATEMGKKYCRVTVSDNGPGIPDRLKKKLFDRLCLSKTKAGGKGFGLCLVKMLLEDFGGRFWVEDRVPGDYTGGCRFVVMLPAL